MIRRNLIAGRWASGDSELCNINPSDTRDVVGVHAKADATQAVNAVEAAVEALPEWRDTSVLTRFEILDRVGDELRARSAELGDLLAREEGKTRREAVAEVVRAGHIFKFFAGEALRTSGQHVDSVRSQVEVDVVPEPLGVVAVITPWNFPMAIPAWKIAPALAFGNTVVFKPAEMVPGSAWALAETLERAGLPAGVLNLVVGSGREVGQAIVGSAAVDGVTFTGSTGVGREVLEAAQAHQARVQLEMGGKNPLVVTSDCDVDLAVRIAVEGAFGSTGQRCTASSRLVVLEKVHDVFVDRLERARAQLVVGDARDEATQIGPVVSAAQLDQVTRYIDLAVSEGAVRSGGAQLDRATPGFYLEPALLTETVNSDTINREEVFGPVASVVKVADYDEALAVVNDTEFGLTAGIVTDSLATATHFKKHARAGMVMVNLPTAGVDFHVPFGGLGGSSYGPREQGSAARDFYTTSKTTYTTYSREAG
ncbi:Aldehyde dehydrogenase, thermostable [Mycolicibacterium vanbaalenii]|uniref:Aldehyde dehydrogenase, thermostable n=1 Tax=Mycolicibacterium vanbaalenii TaxID=110539 RepID=A0A5S9QDT1_MYCVN|nr:aldehyde dehydrogenase family protein [Mycolicibacterium vanbaalenii]CAA0115912.1 Aldehyde dehydrogenase, thermostable [Mycolicibacterium vanbaalenii]